MWKDDPQSTLVIGKQQVSAAAPQSPSVESRPDRPAARPERATQSPAARGACELCGDRARLQVLACYALGRPVMQRFCLSCASTNPGGLESATSTRARLRSADLLGLIGCVLGALVLLSDWLVPQNVTAGFGWHKELAIGLGALLVVVGTLVRGDVLAVTGAFLVVISLVAGLYGLVVSPGVGWKEQFLLFACLLCVTMSLLARARRRRAARRSVSPWTAASTADAPHGGAAQPAAVN